MEPLEEAGVAVPFRAINTVRSGCALHSRRRCCFHRGRLISRFCELLRHLFCFWFCFFFFCLFFFFLFWLLRI